MSRAALTIGSLFTGIGLLDLAVELVTGGELVYQCERDPWRRRVLERHWPAAHRSADVVGFHPPAVDFMCGGFPCFAAGTLITTARGLIPIEAVQRGDLVLTHERRWRAVRSAMQRDGASLVRLKIFGGPPVLTTAEHPFYVRRRHRRRGKRPGSWVSVWDPPRWASAEHLQTNDFIAQPIDIEASETQPSWLTPELAYVIGRWLGDGWIVDHARKSTVPAGKRSSRVNSRMRKVLICCAPHECAELERRIADAGLHATRAPERTVVKYHITSAELVERLRPFGRGAHAKQLAPWAYSMPHELSAAMLQGYVDADGHVGPHERLGVDSVSRALAIGMACLMRRVHGRPPAFFTYANKRTTTIEGRRVEQRPIHTVRLSKANRSAIVADGFAWVPFRKAEVLGMRATVYNISVEQDESYVAESFVVHNCQDLSYSGLGAGLDGERSGLWFEYARIIEETSPRFAFIENVGALERRGLERVLARLDRLGFSTRRGRLTAGDVGATHGRDRMWILAFRSDADRRALADAVCMPRDADQQRQAEPDADPSRVDRAGQLGGADDRRAVADAAAERRQGRSAGQHPAPAGRRDRDGAAARADRELVDADDRRAVEDAAAERRQGRTQPGAPSPVRGRDPEPSASRAVRDVDDADGGRAMADADEDRWQGRRAAHDEDRRDAPRHDDARRRAAVLLARPDHPPGRSCSKPCVHGRCDPEQHGRWALAWHEWIARNPGCEPGLRRAAHGSPGRLVDRGRRNAALGDAVCVHQAAGALVGLLTAEPEATQIGLWAPTE